jgi:hypothetical protein
MLFFLSFLTRFFHRIDNLPALEISAFRTGFVRFDFGLAIGAADKFLRFHREHLSGAIASGLGVALSGDWHNFVYG